MKIRQANLRAVPNVGNLADLASISPQLVFFGSFAPFMADGFHAGLKAAFPNATLVGCTTAGEIADDGVTDGEVVVRAVHFDYPDFKVATTTLGDVGDSTAAGCRLAKQLIEQAGPGLHNVTVLGQGVNINGSALIESFESVLPKTVSLSGGLAGDGAAFKETFTLSDVAVNNRQIVAVGFCGKPTQVRHRTFHGWQPFGPARKVTRSPGDVLFELDGEPALEVYKRYLGEHAKDLPCSSLLSPFELLCEDLNAVGLIRTILAGDEAAGTLVLAGDIVPNGHLKLMHASTDSLVDAAQNAAERNFEGVDGSNERLSLLVSCVGRKLVMGSGVDEEVEAVADVFGKHAHVTGFIPAAKSAPCSKGCSAACTTKP